MKHFIFTFFVFIAVIPLSYSQSFDREVHDAYGRSLILHGLNTAGSAKDDTAHQPWILESDVEREHTDFGFNCVRYLIFWGAIEPEKGKINEAYLRKVKERVEWYTNRHMYVIFDMHQDVFGWGVGGNGAPVWASAHPLIQNLIPDKWPWWMQNLEPKVIRSYVHFFMYRKHKDLQDHYIKSWQIIAQLFHDNPYVLGYDLMNEPHGGKVIKTLAGGFERRQLSKFYKRLIPAIRSVDTVRYVFFEPRSFGVNFGMKAHLPQVHDTKAGSTKLVYSPHCYPKFIDIGGDYSHKYQKELTKWYRVRSKEQTMQKSPMLLGEFGLSATKKGFDAFLRDLNRQADSIHMSWTYWCNTLGGWGPLLPNRSPSPILWELLRVYPQATAGWLLSYSFDQGTRVFHMEYLSNASITKPTEIAIPTLLYKKGYNLSVRGTAQYKTEVDPVTNTLMVYVSEHGAHVTISLSPY
jgi:endoglycosylceramidase